MKRLTEMLLAGILLFLLFAAANLTITWVAGDRLIDFTSTRRYTLSAETERVLNNLPQAVDFRLYVSDGLSGYDWDTAVYAADAAALLSRYRQAAPSKIRLQIRRIKAGSEEEKQAVNDGMQAFSTEEKDYYFGLKAVAADGRGKIVPAFLPTRKNLLEADLNRILASFSEPEELKVGIYSPLLPLTAAEKGQPSPFASLVALLAADYDLSAVSVDSGYVSQDFDVVLVVNPGRLRTLAAYALDQYVMRGGKIVFLVDPYSEIRHRLQGYPPRKDTYMNDFLNVWGIEYDGGKITGDIVNGEKISTGGRRWTYPLWFYATGENAGMLHFRTPGSVRAKEDAKMEFTELASTIGQSGEIDVEKVRYTPKSQAILSYRQDNQRRSLALLAVGEFRSHFRDNPLAGTGSSDKVQPYMPLSTDGAAVAVIADSDFAGDDAWVQSAVAANPVYGTVAYADNAAFLRDLIDRLGGRGKISPSKRAAGAGVNNIAEKFYLTSFAREAAEKEELEERVNEAAARAEKMRRENSGYENLPYMQELAAVEEEHRRAEGLLKNINRRIDSQANRLLNSFIVLNMLLFPVLFVAGIWAVVWLRRVYIARGIKKTEPKR